VNFRRGNNGLCEDAGKTAFFLDGKIDDKCPILYDEAATTSYALYKGGIGMKFQRAKDIALGAIVATLVVGTAPVAFAKVANMNIPVQYNNIKVVVDGKELSTSKEPFVYDGTTYLPLRAVAEAVGMDVTWDAATKTANFTAKPFFAFPKKKPSKQTVFS